MNTTETNINQSEKANPAPFTAYEYTSVTVRDNSVSLYKDCYNNFGWMLEGAFATLGGTSLQFKRNRKINNRAEICHLQQKCVNALQAIEKLEDNKSTSATSISLLAGLIGTAFVGGATFCYLGSFIIPCVLLAIPGFAVWSISYFLYKKVKAKSIEKILPQIDSQYDMIYESCSRANALMA